MFKSHKKSETRFSNIESKLDSFDQLKTVVNDFLASQEELCRQCVNNKSELYSLRECLKELQDENRALREETVSLRGEGLSLREAVAEIRSDLTHWSQAIEQYRSMDRRMNEWESKVSMIGKGVEASNDTITAMANDVNRYRVATETTISNTSTMLHDTIQIAVEHIDSVEARLDEKMILQETLNQTMLAKCESLSRQFIDNIALRNTTTSDSSSVDVDFSSEEKAAQSIELQKNELNAHLQQLHDHNAKIDLLIHDVATMQGRIADVNVSISKLFKYVSKNCTTHMERSTLVESIENMRESISTNLASELERDKLMCIRINNIHASIERLYKHCERIERHLESKLNDIDVNFTKHDKLFMTLLR